MSPLLLALDDSPNIPLDKPIVLIGRHQECDVQIPSRKISRRHCCVAQVADYLVVRDLGSTNGIRINGTRVVEGKLAIGDELVIGNMPYQVQWQDERAVPLKPVTAPLGSLEIGESSDIPLALLEADDLPEAPRAKPLGIEQMITFKPPRRTGFPPPLPPDSLDSYQAPQ